MKRIGFVALALACACVLADTNLKNDGTLLGPVITLDCAVDGGLQCSRPTGASTGKLKCASASSTTPGCVDTASQTFAGAKKFNGNTTVNGTSTLDGGVTVAGALVVTGPLKVDGGVTISGSVGIDGGLQVRSSAIAGSFSSTSGFYLFNLRTDGGQAYIEGDDPASNIELGALTGTVNGSRILTAGDISDGGIAFASYRGSYTTDHAWLDGGSCNTWTVSGISGPTCGDGCLIGSEHAQPLGLQLTCQFENADGGTGAATRVVVTRCCNDTVSSNGCDPPSTYYHVTGIAQ